VSHSARKKTISALENLSLPLPNRRVLRIVPNDDDDDVVGRHVNGAVATAAAAAAALKAENTLLRDAVRELEVENERLKQSGRIVLETFEGEGRFRESSKSTYKTAASVMNSTFLEATAGITMSGVELEQDADSNLWCDSLEDGTWFGYGNENWGVLSIPKNGSFRFALFGDGGCRLSSTWSSPLNMIFSLALWRR
jgi:uncharacterized protein YyaL (SSP411 family)